MKKLMLTVCLVLGLLIAPMAMADTLQIGYPGPPQSNYGPYTSGNGGEFTVKAIGGWVDLSIYSAFTQNVGAAGTFQTFCVEHLEYIYPNNPIYTAVLNSKAVYGGQPTGGDTLSVGAAWLYAQFATGTLAGYNYGVNRTTTAGALQDTIWWLEGEAGDPGALNIFRQGVIANFGSEVAAKADNAFGGYGVKVINLWEGQIGGTGNERQDMLVYVPEPGILILLGLAMSAIGAASWKISKL